MTGRTDDEKLPGRTTRVDTAPIDDASPGVVPADDAILPDRGKPVPESLHRDKANHGVLDPAETGHPMPEGLERKPAGPLNKDTGRRIKGGGGG
jgi:hypothetical protein